MTKKEEVNDYMDNAKGSIKQALNFISAKKFEEALVRVANAERRIKNAGHNPKHVDINEIIMSADIPKNIRNVWELRIYIKKLNQLTVG